MSVERARQRLASRAHVSQALPGGARWRRLELLADAESLRWLCPPGDVVSHAAIRADGAAQG